MRAILQKIGALLLAVGALAALLAQAALAHGCGAPAKQSEAQAPDSSSGEPGAAASRAPDPEYMGATKAPPLPAFRGSSKSSAGGDVDETEDARDDGAQQQQAP